MTCSICTEKFTIMCRTKKLICGHLFHKKCINKWLKVNLTCPLCRVNIQQRKEYKSILADITHLYILFLLLIFLILIVTLLLLYHTNDIMLISLLIFIIFCDIIGLIIFTIICILKYIDIRKYNISIGNV